RRLLPFLPPPDRGYGSSRRRNPPLVELDAFGSAAATRNAVGEWALGRSGKGQQGRDARAGMRPEAGGIWLGTRTTPVVLVATAKHLLQADRTRAEQGGAVEPVMERLQRVFGASGMGQLPSDSHFPRAPRDANHEGRCSHGDHVPHVR
ncbi:unnamed protein product, partial [Urochloa humidicola]